MARGLELRFLGEMEVLRDGIRLELPPSKKTRALLAYLALSGRPQRRERLCQLLWDVADDPRGALRWSLSRLRPLVDEPERPRIQAARDRVSFEPLEARVDLLWVRGRMASGLEAASLAELEALTREFRGELLEGLELDELLDFQAWCVAEREEARKLHARLLRELIARLGSAPETALPHARALASVDPLDHAARAGLVRLLAATGRRREAEQQYEAAGRLLTELGGAGSPELEAALRTTPDPAAAPPPASPQPWPSETSGVMAATDFLGRAAELDRLSGLLDETLRQHTERALLVLGEPGLGKSRLLDELRRAARLRGATVLAGRAYEAEAGRPFGPWIDALRRLPPSALRSELGALLPEYARETGAPLSRDRLFAAVVELLAERAAAAPPVVLVLDDVQWLDAASAELLHFVARTSRARPVLLALAARAGELADNEAVQRTLRSLRDLRLLEELPLAPLGREDACDLARRVAPGIDARHVFAESGGNPLFALELARWDAGGEAGRVPGSLSELIRHRAERLPPEAGDVLRWAAVLGHDFDAGRLGALMALDGNRLLSALELLERHSLLRASDGSPGYQFAHDVVRRAIYSELSQPRRRLMHLRIAETLEREASDGGAAELVHHAALAGESALAARASVRAGRLFLRQFANAEAWATARRGRRHAAAVPEPERTALLLELLQVEHQARRPGDVEAAGRELETLSERALDQGDPEHARLGFHMLAYLRWEDGDLGGAQRDMTRAEQVGRVGDERAQVLAIAEAARCLVLLEHDLPRAEALALEAGARSSRAGLEASAVADAQGLLRQHQGRLDDAAALFQEALRQARRGTDAMGEFQALEHLVVVRQEQGDWTGARLLAQELTALGGKLREGSEAPFARALLALCGYALGDAGAGAALEEAIEELRVVDAKLRFAYTLNRAARLDLRRGDAARARVRAVTARQAAAALGRPTEMLLAGVALARAERELDQGPEAETLLGELSDAAAGASELARQELAELLGH